MPPRCAQVLAWLLARWFAFRDPRPQPQQSLASRLTQLMLARTIEVTRMYTGMITARIPKLDSPTAAQMSTLLIAESVKARLCLWGLAACMFQESRFSPGAYNRNLAESEGTISFDGTDWGCGQFSGRTARTWFPPGSDEAQMQTQLLDPCFAVPRFVQLYQELYAHAQHNLPADLPRILSLPSWCYQPTQDPEEQLWWYASVLYNAGPTGLKQILQTQGYKVHRLTHTPELHGHAVQTWYRQFKPMLQEQQ